MIKHIVMWKLKENALGNIKSVNSVLIKEKLEGLKGKIEGLVDIEVGVDFSLGDASADVVLYSVFETREALDKYQVHPLHKEVVGFIGEIRTERRVVDYEI